MTTQSDINKFYEELAEMLPINSNINYSRLFNNYTKNILKEQLITIEPENLVVANRDIIFNNPIYTPCRGINCEHIEAIEAKVYINFCIKHNKCLICEKELKADEIYIDSLLNELYKSNNDKFILFSINRFTKQVEIINQTNPTNNIKKDCFNTELIDMKRFIDMSQNLTLDKLANKLKQNLKTFK